MNDFFSSSKVAQKRGREVWGNHAWLSWDFLMAHQYRPWPTAKVPPCTPHTVLHPRVQEKGKEQIMLSWSLPTGTVAVIRWPELLHQRGNLGYYKAHPTCRQEEWAPLELSPALWGAPLDRTAIHGAFLFFPFFFFLMPLVRGSAIYCECKH